MINTSEILQTVRMITEEKLDIRTITMGISLYDCVHPDRDILYRNVYDRITTQAKDLVRTGEALEREFGIPIVNKRISVTPIALVASACETEDFVPFAKAMDSAAKTCGVDFIGGFDEVFNSQVNIPATNIVIRGFEKASLWCNVTGHSMEPKINHGDIIALHQCTLNDIQYGEIYAVVLDTIRTIKILRRSPDPDKLRFIPINTNDYDEQEFDKSRIINVFEVIGSISKFF